MVETSYETVMKITDAVPVVSLINKEHALHRHYQDACVYNISCCSLKKQYTPCALPTVVRLGRTKRLR